MVGIGGFKAAFEVQRGQQIFEVQFRIGNRDIPIPSGDVESLAARVVTTFETPNQCIRMSADARSLFAGFQACCNSEAALQTNDLDDHRAARNGLAPWHIGMLAAANLIFEIAIGEKAADCRTVEKYHSLRAWSQVQVSPSLTDIWTQQAPSTHG